MLLSLFPHIRAQLPPAALSPAEAALQAIKSVEALEVIGKLHYNLAGGGTHGTRLGCAGGYPT